LPDSLLKCVKTQFVNHSGSLGDVLINRVKTVKRYCFYWPIQHEQDVSPHAGVHNSAAAGIVVLGHAVNFVGQR
jgi:hypothetical protein